MQFESHLSQILLSALKAIKPGVDIKPEDITVSPSEDPGRGDFSTNCCLKLSRLLELPPMDLGKKVAEIILSGKDVFIERVDLASPGFINIFITSRAFQEMLLEILDKGGRLLSDESSKKKVLLEFLSANPTGPLTVAHGRHAACGDALANILKAAGYKVTREYYYNDSGRQMETLGKSLRIRYLQLLGEKRRMLKDGYRGQYLQDIARKMVERHKKAYAKEKDVSVFADFAEKEILKDIKDSLSLFRVRFDSWIRESNFTESGKVKKVLDHLKKSGEAYEREGAVWLKSTNFKDEKDRVLVKSTGEATYLLPDLAYHAFKYKRGYDRLITTLGPDHHGYIQRLRAGIRAMGLEDEKLTVKIIQIVSLYRGKKKMRMSTRAGEFITLRRVIDEVGVDAARFFLAMRGLDSHLDFDMELAKKESAENPVYYIQYAHARISSVFKFARQKKITLKKDSINLGLLSRKEETELLKKLSLYPSVIKRCAELLEVQALTGYLLELASLFHRFYNKYRFITGEDDLTQARLLLAKGIRIVLRNGLKLLGINAPLKM